MMFVWAGLLLLTATTAQAVDWGASQWIGYTADVRPPQWSHREVIFNKPPADIWKWKPTERELRSSQRKAFVSPMLRATFTVDKPVRSAEAIVFGLGLFEFYLNGDRVGDHVLEPAQTSYDKRAFYVRHDVSGMISNGTNAVGVWLGNGFYGQNIGFAPNLSYGPPRVRMFLQLTHEDGSTQRLESDDRWSARISLSHGNLRQVAPLPQKWW
jgi:alpha-L-rhamnosidase